MSEYIDQIIEHYESYFHKRAVEKEQQFDDFVVLEFPPNVRHDSWAYCTVGMSLNSTEKIELVLYSPVQDDSLVELLTMTAYYHQTHSNLSLNHSFDIGRPWLPTSNATCGFISLPYLDGPEFELIDVDNETIHCYWLIPITVSEKEYLIKNGVEALETLFESKQIEFLNVSRNSLV